MEWLLNLFVFAIIGFSIISKFKKASDKLKTSGPNSSPFAPTFNPDVLRVSGMLLANKNVDKVISVYGPGASISTEEVAVLLKVNEQSAQNILEQMQSSGKAVPIRSAGGHNRYKII